MATKEELQALLDRVEKATGADSQLNRDLVKAFDTSATCDFVSWPPRLTGSVDDALWLVERLLPVCGVQMGVDPSGCGAHINWWPDGLGGKRVTGEGCNVTIPLAILAALLRALIAEVKP